MLDRCSCAGPRLPPQRTDSGLSLVLWDFRAPICVHWGCMSAFYLRRLGAVFIAMGALWAQPSWAEEGPQVAEEARAAEVPADPIARRAAEFTERTRRMMLGDADRIREASARRSARTGEIEALSVQLDAALALPPASQERQAQIDQTAQSLQNLVDRILDDRAQAMAAHAEANRA